MAGEREGYKPMVSNLEQAEAVAKLWRSVSSLPFMRRKLIDKSKDPLTGGLPGGAYLSITCGDYYGFVVDPETGLKFLGLAEDIILERMRELGQDISSVKRGEVAKP